MKETILQKWQVCLAFAVLMAAAYLLYMQMFSGVWLMDDLPVIVNNPDIRSFANFLEDYYPGRPLRELTYLVDYHFFGLEPSGYYVQHLFWHGLCAGLVFLAARLLRAPWPVAWLSALLFMIHPVQVEVVANNSHRKDSLALAFCLMSLCSYLHARNTAPPKKRWLLAALSFWGIALTAKQNAVVLPLVVAACELCRLPPHRRRPALWASVAAGGLGGVGWLVYLGGSQAFKADIGPALRKLGHFSGGGLEEYALTVFKSWAFMASKLIRPVELSMEYAFPVPTHWGDPWVVCGIAGAVIAVLGIFWTCRRSVLICAGFSWFVAFWLPTSNVFGHLSYFAADRYWYAPATGLFLLAAYGTWRLLRGNLAAYTLFATALLSLLGWQTWRQQRLWCDEKAFYAHMQRVNPEALESLIGLGHNAMARDDYPQATEYLQKAFLRSPLDDRIPQNLGHIAYRQGHYDQALNYFQQALALNPADVEIYNNLGSLYDDLNQPQRAVEALERALAINPHFEKAYTNLGMVYDGMGQLQKAEQLHRKALAELPGYGLAHYNLGNTLYHAGRKREALDSYSRASQLDPDNADALYNYAVVAGELGMRDIVPSLVARLKELDAGLAAELEKELYRGF